jgi:hypothetical protein
MQMNTVNARKQFPQIQQQTQNLLTTQNSKYSTLFYASLSDSRQVDE